MHAHLKGRVWRSAEKKENSFLFHPRQKKKEGAGDRYLSGRMSGSAARGKRGSPVSSRLQEK